MKNNIFIRPALASDSLLIASLARVIWTEHYVSIIGMDQVEYMLNKFQSPDAIAEQITDQGYLYFIAYYDGNPAGYMAIRPDFAKNSLFLSKLYVERGYRRKGIAREFMTTALDFCRKNSLPSIWLTVNKNNSSSIAAYRKMGFSVVEEVVTDIGGGFVMDDYIMRHRTTMKSN